MKKTFLMLSLVVSALSGCAGVPSTEPATQHDHQHGGMMMDMKAMCEMHRHMSGMSMAEHEAMIDKKMPGMTPEQRQQRMKMMDEHCK